MELWIDNGILVCWKIKKKVNIKLLNYDFWINNDISIVKCKNDFILKQSNNIWDKMWVVLLFNRKYVFDRFSLDLNYLTYWFWFYQNYDEEIWKYITYLNWYKPDELNETEDFLNSFLPSFDLVLNDWVLVINSKLLSLNVLEKISNELEEMSITRLLSFLIWISFLYWTFDIKEWILNSIKIQLKLNGNMMIYSSLINRIWERLRNMWLFISVSHIVNKLWEQKQIVINDYEILELIRKLLIKFEVYDSLENKKYLKMFKDKEKLLMFISRNNFSNDAEFRTQLNSLILKIIEK